jgi:hypothetical protein
VDLLLELVGAILDCSWCASQRDNPDSCWHPALVVATVVFVVLAVVSLIFSN